MTEDEVRQASAEKWATNKLEAAMRGLVADPTAEMAFHLGFVEGMLRSQQDKETSWS